MKRIKYEFYAIKEVLQTGRAIIKGTGSIRHLIHLFTEKGEYTTWNGETKRGTYYSYRRDFWTK